MHTVLPRFLTWFTLLAIGVGAWLRVQGWFDAPVMWLDECYLACNIVGRDFLGLLHPLEYSQSAPLLFMAATKAIVGLFGPHDLAFRTMALLASCAHLALYGWLCLRCLKPIAAFLATCVVALLPRLVFYASELKQYSTEAFVLTALTALTVLWFEKPESERRFYALVAAGALGLFLAHTAVFALAAIGLAIVLNDKETLHRLVTWRRGATAVLVWGVLFLVNYHFVIAVNYGEDVMKNYWSQAYPGMPTSLDRLEHWRYLLSSALHYFHLRTTATGVLIVLAAWGWASHFRNQKATLALWLGPLGFYWIAGMLNKAPFASRHLVFVVPAVIGAIALGCFWFVTSLPHRLLKVGASLVLFACTLSLIHRTAKIRVPKPDSKGVPEAMAALSTAVQKGDTLVLTSRPAPFFRIYAGEELRPPRVNIEESPRSFDWVETTEIEKKPKPNVDAFLLHVQTLPVESRTWYIFSGYLENEEVARNGLERIFPGRIRLYWSHGGSSIYLREALIAP